MARDAGGKGAAADEDECECCEQRWPKPG